MSGFWELSSWCNFILVKLFYRCHFLVDAAKIIGINGVFRDRLLGTSMHFKIGSFLSHIKTEFVAFFLMLDDL